MRTSRLQAKGRREFFRASARYTVLGFLGLVAAVVVLTMLAAQSFDPRLIWDAADRRGVQHG